MNYERSYRELLTPLVKRELALADGLSEADICAAEQCLGLRLPQALREYYRVAGRLDEVNRCHDRLFSLEELEIMEGHLMFMEENQAVVLWGVQAEHVERADPEVWQAVNNTPLEWYAENTRVSKFLHEMIEWQMSFEE